MAQAILNDFATVWTLEIAGDKIDTVILYIHGTFLADHLALFAAFRTDRILHVHARC
jgi:hypothetical protein